MDNQDIRQMLQGVADGRVSVDEAVLSLKKKPFTDLGFAKADHHRSLRQGAGEVIYGAGKSAEQITAIAKALMDGGSSRVLITRMRADKAADINIDGFRYYEEASLAVIGGMPEADGRGTIVVASGGTSDLYAAEEAALTAQFLGNDVVRLYDVGVSGLHRLLSHMDEIMTAQVIIAAAGMEGALASVIGGLSSCPVIAVPTSVGYGSNFGGLSALLSMLNSCASSVSVVNIDNGFGAAYQASLINHPDR